MKNKSLRNFYDVLNVPPTASPKAINDKHRALAKKYHPDVNSSTDAHEKMTKLNEAYEVLSDKNKRDNYDRALKQSQQQVIKQTTATRAEQAEQLRKKAEAKLKADEAIRAQRMAHAKKRADEKAYQQQQVELVRKLVQERENSDKEQAIDLLSMLVRKGNARISRDLETDEARHHAIKVLLSLVKDDKSHIRRQTEEAERKQRIEEILALVKEKNEED
ncbi:MAG: DnaJ domain-containing protein [Oscillospiraceae bacterium]|nr:DnaJ domain-containing protein [Oscillospiraceae bacterium]